ncbi:MAG: hypothetical protein P8018_10140 [Acidobacteriota bacterium]|jgi:hypothetical protein
MYDPMDEAVDDLFGRLQTLLREIPERLAKQSLAALFEDMALRQVLLEEGETEYPADPGAREALLARHWERVDALRNEFANNWLRNIQRQEF